MNYFNYLSRIANLIVKLPIVEINDGINFINAFERKRMIYKLDNIPLTNTEINLKRNEIFNFINRLLHNKPLHEIYVPYCRDFELSRDLGIVNLFQVEDAMNFSCISGIRKFPEHLLSDLIQMDSNINPNLDDYLKLMARIYVYHTLQFEWKFEKPIPTLNIMNSWKGFKNPNNHKLSHLNLVKFSLLNSGFLDKGIINTEECFYLSTIIEFDKRALEIISKI